MKDFLIVQLDKKAININICSSACIKPTVFIRHPDRLHPADACRWIRLDLVAVLIIHKPLRRARTGEALSVSAAAAIMLAALFSAGFIPNRFIRIGIVKRLAGRSFERIIVVMLPRSFLSTFTHHVTMTAIMLPPVMNLSRESDIPASNY
jgi:hypothetical protein